MDKEEMVKKSEALLKSVVPEAIVHWLADEYNVNQAQAIIAVRMAQHRKIEAETLEAAIHKALDLIDDGGDIDAITLALCVTEGEWIGTKAVHQAKLRRGIK